MIKLLEMCGEIHRKRRLSDPFRSSRTGMFAYRLTEKHERTGIRMTKTRQCELNMRPLRFDHVGSTSKIFHL